MLCLRHSIFCSLWLVLNMYFVILYPFPTSPLQGQTGEIFHETSLQPVGCQTDGQYLDRPTVSVTGQTNNASKTAVSYITLYFLLSYLPNNSIHIGWRAEFRHPQYSGTIFLSWADATREPTSVWAGMRSNI